MVFYEMFCIIADLERPALIESIKRVTKCIVTNGGMIREYENLGRRITPTPFRSYSRKPYEGFANYLLIRYHGRPDRNFQIAHDVKSEVIRQNDARDEYINYVIDQIDKASLTEQIGINNRTHPQVGALRKAKQAVRELTSVQSAMTTNCICEKYGRFISSHIEYDRPVAYWGKRIIDPLYKRRL
ncbi:hypothetical protein ACOME3_003861 [Neoechinorhynchus agilis]